MHLMCQVQALKQFQNYKLIKLVMTVIQWYLKIGDFCG